MKLLEFCLKFERPDIRSITSWKEYESLIATWKYANFENNRWTYINSAVVVTVRPLANHDGDGDSNENTTKQNISREKALRMRLTICTSQRPRQNINIHSQPNLRGLRTGKPTTNWLCFFFKLERAKNATKKDYTSRKSRAKAPHVC